MVLSAPPTTCRDHHRRAQVAACGSCGSALCSDCVVHTSVGIKCRRCTGVKATAARVEGGRGAPTRRRWAVPVAMSGLIVAGVAGFAVIGGGGSGSPSGSGGTTFLTTSAVDRPTSIVGAKGLTLGATLTLPAGAGGDPVPSVLIVPGGATMDRNYLTGFRGAVPDPLYEDLALAAVGSGMAVLRYDQRGTASAQRPAGDNLAFDDYVADAQGGVELLYNRRETAGAPIALVGYDNGGLVALKVAAADPRVKAVVLISTTGRPLADYLADDFVASFGAEGEPVATALRAAAREALAGRIPPQTSLLPAIKGIFPADPSLARYTQETFALDPIGIARGVTVPTLFLRGALDTAITDADVAAYQSALAGGFEVMTGADTGHSMLLPVNHGDVVHEGATETPRDNELLTGMAEWLRVRLQAAT